MDKETATRLLIEDRFPLMTQEIQEALSVLQIELNGPPAGAWKKIWLQFPDHFSNFFYQNTDRDTAKRVVIAVANDDTGWELTEIHRDILIKLLQEAYDFQSTLRNLPSAEFHLSYSELRKKQKEKRILSATEYDHTCFYMFPEADADMETWVAYPTWTVEEAVAIAFKKNPEIVSSATIEAAVGNNHSPFLEAYKTVKKYIEGSIEIGELKLPLTPAQMIQWGIAKKEPFAFGLLMPIAEHLEKIEKLNDRIELLELQGSRREKSVDEMNPKSRKSHRMLLLVMAFGRYKHKMEGNSGAITSIMDSAGQFGLSIDRKTVKSILDAAIFDEDMADDIAAIRLKLTT